MASKSPEMTFIKVADGLLSPADPYTEDAVDRLTVGDVYHGKLARARNPAFLRKYFALLRIAFEAWEPKEAAGTEYNYGTPEKNFEVFRRNLTILCGYSEPVFNINGTFKLEAKSINFASMDESEFEALYNKLVDVLLIRVFGDTWSKDDVDGTVDKILGMVG